MISDISTSLCAVERARRKPRSFVGALPPCAGRAVLLEGREVILEQLRADPPGRLGWKRVRLQEIEHLGRALKKTHGERRKPRILPRASEGSEPHLPIEPRLMGRDEA